MKYIITIVATFLFFNMSTFFHAQNKLEFSYSKLNSVLNEKLFKLVSLNSNLEKKVNIINAEKLKSVKDNNLIIKLLSSTSILTNEIDNTQLEIDELTKKIEVNKKELFEIYSIQIDSLHQSKVDEKIKSVEIIKLIEKRLLVSPIIDILSFSPQSILKLKLPQKQVEKKIYNEYLTDAFNEIENKIKEISTLRLEISNIIQLNEETKEFLEDIDFENNFAVYTNPKTDLNTSSDISYRGVYEEGRDIRLSNSLNTQTKSFSEILYQFGLSNSLSSNTLFKSGNYSGNNNLQNFSKLMKAVEEQLDDYKTIINNKLKTTNSE